MAKLQDGWVFIPKVVMNEKEANIEVREYELVFCENCKHYKETTIIGCAIGFCKQKNIIISKDDYCKFGEREEDEE